MQPFYRKQAVARTAVLVGTCAVKDEVKGDEWALRQCQKTKN
jgi:hypothetical protein